MNKRLPLLWLVLLVTASMIMAACAPATAAPTQPPCA
jgi:hypothetical protein